MLAMDFDKVYEVVDRVRRSISGVVVGKKHLLDLILATFIAGGHVLLEGPPGTAKTLIAKAIARAIGGSFARVQGNPDILPTDLTGYYIYGLDGSRRFVRGPVFSNILMFDELNRTPPRVQSALLQAMAEYKVSIDGVDHDLPKPFHVIATEIPIEQEIGIYPLTLTLRDRFWVRCVSMYNPMGEEIEIVKRADKLYTVDASDVEKTIELDEYLRIQEFISKEIFVDDRIIHYIAELINYIRNHRYVRMGMSHRGSIFLYRIAKALALMNRRDYVIPDDIKEIAVEVLVHRIVLTDDAIAEGVKPEDIVREALNNVKVPKE
uniref:MoxR family ATPase n=1 Tax=Ignisphaera aggregans TaxID=334771 RepID=A0A7C4NQ60_9CREN